ncbi:hypothetical protein F2Q69_00022854 [Brassica cretica]|uniref:Uncharacterized protein n=1 Tax=Brassica cretica TaxID=69181 RepID=A0A8S9QBW3_BRACR|nr:hypothetical protein F2Q69_00022854 [Brassica cretica]
MVELDQTRDQLSQPAQPAAELDQSSSVDSRAGMIVLSSAHECTQAVRSLGSLLNYVRLDPRKRFEVHQHPVAEYMPVLLKSGQSASREEAVEEMKDCRSMKQHWCRSKVMREYGLSIFDDRLKPRSNHKLPECP